jgi:hypothetical protein
MGKQVTPERLCRYYFASLGGGSVVLGRLVGKLPI